MGLGYLAASLRDNGFSVLVVNAEQELNRNEELLSIIKIEQPRIVGLSPVAATMQESLDLAYEIKKKYPAVHITFGGHHVTSSSLEIMVNETFIDSIVLGEGEKSIVELAKYVIEKKNDADLSGVSIRISDEIKQGNKQLIHNIDTIQNPARDTLILALKANSNCKEARIITSRGCIGNCSFCTSPFFYNRIWRAHSATYVVDEMERLVNDFGIHHFWISDDSYIINRADSQNRAKEIAREILRRGLNITYRALIRADSFSGAEEMIPLLIESGLNSVFVGLESASKLSLDIYNKGTSLKTNVDIVELVRSFGINLQFGFIMFNPYCTIQDLLQNASFLFEIQELYRFFPLTRAVDVFPGTKLCAQLINNKLLNDSFSYKSNETYDYRFLHREVERVFQLITKDYDSETENIDTCLLARFFNRTARINDLSFAELNMTNYNYFMKLLKSDLSDAEAQQINSIRKCTILEIVNNLGI